jgi:hypothetical protein
MDENWTMTNDFYSREWKVNDVDWISYIMDENWIMKNKFIHMNEKWMIMNELHEQW